MQPEEFDLLILGGGTGSTIAAWTFAGERKRVAVVDRKYIGGSCPNIALIALFSSMPSIDDVADTTSTTGAVALLNECRNAVATTTISSSRGVCANVTANQDLTTEYTEENPSHWVLRCYRPHKHWGGVAPKSETQESATVCRERRW